MKKLCSGKEAPNSKGRQQLYKKMGMTYRGDVKTEWRLTLEYFAPDFGEDTKVPAMQSVSAFLLVQYLSMAQRWHSGIVATHFRT